MNNFNIKITKKEKICEINNENEYIKDYIDEMIFSFTQYIDSYENCNYFYEICNDSIKRYNGGF